LTYASDQLSVSDSAPRHLFIFTGTPTVYRYTSAEADLTYSANLYTALAGLTHGSMPISAEVGNARELIVEMPITAQVVQDFGFGMPMRNLSFALLRLQQLSGVATKQWEGEVADIAAVGKLAKLRIPNKAAQYEVNVPGWYRQRGCNVPLFSTACGVSRATQDWATTVSSVSANGKTVVVASVNGVSDQIFRPGEIVRDTDGERRTIVSQIGTTLLLDAPFRTLVATNAVTLYSGCDGAILTCHSKFNNVARFRGLPFVGADGNPFKRGFGRY